jgi:hypothetical protein
VLSIGSCTVTEVLAGGATGTSTPLSAGTVTVTGPTGGPVILNQTPIFTGELVAQLASGAIPQTGGTFTFNGTGGTSTTVPNVGSFAASVTFPNPILSWTNQNAAASVTRSAGLTVTWTGGAPGSYVIISGNSSSGSANGSYSCYAPQSALSFTVPSYVLGTLPSGSGTTMVENATNFATFTASGLDFGFGLGFMGFSVNSIYN